MNIFNLGRQDESYNTELLLQLRAVNAPGDPRIGSNGAKVWKHRVKRLEQILGRVIKTHGGEHA